MHTNDPPALWSEVLDDIPDDDICGRSEGCKKYIVRGMIHVGQDFSDGIPDESATTFTYQQAEWQGFV